MNKHATLAYVPDESLKSDTKAEKMTQTETK